MPVDGPVEERNRVGRAAVVHPSRAEREAICALLRVAGLAVEGEFESVDDFLAQPAAPRPDLMVVALAEPEQVARLSGPNAPPVVLHITDRRIAAPSAWLERAGELDAIEDDGTTLEWARVLNRLAQALLFDGDDVPPVTPPQGSPALARLSEREREVLTYVAAGADNLKIAAHLGIRERTVKAHVSALFRKLDCENRTQLALLARELGVAPAGDV